MNAFFVKYFFLLFCATLSICAMENDEAIYGVQLPIQEQDKIHRETVAELIKKNGPGIIGTAAQKKVRANGWIPQTSAISGMTADSPFIVKSASLISPMAAQKLSFFHEYKTSLIVAAIAGAIVVGWTAYELISAYKKVSQDEWDKTQSWSEKLALVSSKSNLTKLLNRLR